MGLLQGLVWGLGCCWLWLVLQVIDFGMRVVLYFMFDVTFCVLCDRVASLGVVSWGLLCRFWVVGLRFGFWKGLLGFYVWVCLYVCMSMGALDVGVGLCLICRVSVCFD